MENFNRLYKQKLKQGISIFTFQFVMLLLLLPNLLKAQTIGSSADYPFPISTVQQLATLAGQVNEGGVFYYNPSDGKYYNNNATGYIAIANMAEGSYFKLVEDIVSNPGDVASCAGVEGSFYTWSMLGNMHHPFDGHFDGDHHTVSGFLVLNNATDGSGFFGAIANHAEIKNLGVVNSYIGGTNSTGGLVGYALGGSIENCFFTGTIVSSGNYTGGLVGQMSEHTSISNSYASATITSSGNQLGGIVGKVNISNDDCTLQNVYSSCILHGNFQYTGGIVGENVDNGTVFTNCYYDQQLIDCRVTPNSDPSSTGAGTAMTTTAMANGTWAPAGFTATGSGTNQYPYITDFSLSDDAVLFSTVPLFLPPGASLSDLSTVNTVTVGDVAGVTWTELERVGIGSFVSPTLNVIGQSYVVLKATKGSNSRTYVLQFDEAPYLGSAENPFPINNITNLTDFRDGINTGANFLFKHFNVPASGANTYFKQTADITMPNSNWDGIGNANNTPFKGIYDGNGKKIIGLKQDATASAFFVNTEGATIKNLTMHQVKSGVYAALIYSMQGGTVDNCHATGSTAILGGLIYETANGDFYPVIKNSTNSNSYSTSSRCAGGIVSMLYSTRTTIDNCHNYGNIQSNGADNGVGGVVGGERFQSGALLTITNCSNRGTITNTTASKDSYVGGVVGHVPSGSSISHCHNIGNVRGGAQYVGGVVGVAGSSPISYCYNLGRVYSYGSSSQIGQNMGGISASATNISYSFNAGKVNNLSETVTYAIANAEVPVCFNAGDVQGGVNGTYLFQNNATNKGSHYAIGRIQGGGETYLGGCYYDKTRVPAFSNSSNATGMTLSNMTGTGSGTLIDILGTTDWVHEAGTYPRIKGLDTCTISKVLALPIVFANATDNVDNVTADFQVRSQWGIVWEVEGATISAPSGNYQTVTLPANRTGYIVLKARYEDTCYYRINLVMAVDAPTSALTVDNLTDLQNLRTGVNSGAPFTYKGTAVPAGGKGTTFKVTTDITMPSSNWTPIGTETNPFMGTFDGDGHALSGLKQSDVQYAGLFFYVYEGTITNLKLTNISVGSRRHLGGLCTYLQKGTISNCRVTGSITYTTDHSDGSMKYRGGLVGIMSGNATVIGCYNEAIIKTTVGTTVGGIVGRAMSNSTCVIERCTNAGTISQSPIQAGISGQGGKIRQCVNYGNITGIPRTTRIAGIVAEGGVVEGCVNSGCISVPQLAGTAYVSGIASGNNTCSVSYSYNVGEIIGNNASQTCGIGPTGSSGSCNRCYNAGKVTGSSAFPVTNSTSRATNCFYDKQTSVTLGGGGTAKLTAEMCGTALSSSLNNGSNVYFEYADNMYPRVKGIENTPASLATAAPVLLANEETVDLVNTDFEIGGCVFNVAWSEAAGGSALTIKNDSCKVKINAMGITTIQSAVNDTVYKTLQLSLKMDAFIIKDATELANFRNGINSGAAFFYRTDSTFHTTNVGGNLINVPALGEGATFRLAENGTFDMQGVTWTPIGNSTNKFKGTFDGQNKTISNFKLGTGTYKGLFGYVDAGEIQNLTIEGVKSATTTGQYSGILAGRMDGSTVNDVTIRNCSINGNNSHVGTLMGYGSQTLIYNPICERDTIKGTSDVGGVVGYASIVRVNNSTLDKCSITGTSKVGGVMGEAQSNTSYIHISHITDLYIKATGSNVGGAVGSGSAMTIDEFYLLSGMIDASTTSSDVVGGIVGSGSCVTMYNSSNNASVIGHDKVSGIFAVQGSCNPALYNVTNTGDVTGNQYVSGILSYESSSTRYISVYNAVNTGKITGKTYVGGIRAMGTNITASAVYNCINLGDVEGVTYVGGIIGTNKSNAYYCVNAGRVSGTNYVGGITGYQSNNNGYSTHDCISVGQVSGEQNVGNIVGMSEEGGFSNCYYDKQVSPNYKGVGSAGDDVAGLAEGKNTAEMLNTTLGMSGFAAKSGLYPRLSGTYQKTSLLETDASYVAATPVNLTNDKTAFNIPGDTNYVFTPYAGNGVTWTSQETALRNNNGTFKPKAAGGDVLTATKGDFAKHLNVSVGVSKEFPCIIKNHAELAKFTQYVNSGNTFYYNTAAADQNPETFSSSEPENFLTGIKINPGGADAFFKLADDFNPDFQTETWEGPIGTTAHPFLGEFNGNGRTVSNLPSGTTDTCGFFGVNKGIVYDLTIENPNMTNTSRNKVGALCGYNEGTFTNCHVVNGTVAGAQYVGGLVGYNKGFIEDCHNSATVNGTQYVGGISGRSTKAITRCFNLGDISASNTSNTYLGGIAGFAENDAAAVTYCFNAGRITATGSSSKFVGGIAGDKTGSNFGNCYNIGEVTAPTATNTGALAGRVGNALVNTVAYDKQMCTVTGAYGSGNGNATAAFTSAMLGTSMQSVLGNDGTWTYTEGLYPRLTSMKDMEASVAAATPMHIAEGENVANVEHEFSVSTDNSVVWTVEPETGVLDMSNFPTINFIRCGIPELSVKQGAAGKELKKIKISINYTASVVEYDTACGGSFFHWPVNGLDYYATNDVVYNTTEGGCPVTHILHVTVPAVLAAEVATVDQQCYNTNTGRATATVTGGFGKYSYSWKDEHGDEVSTTNPATGLAPGTYSLTVTDGKPVPKNPGDEYCTVTVEDIVINPVTELVARIDTFSAGCYNTDDGMFQISFEGGVPDYTISWNNDGVSPALNTPRERYEINGLSNGTYHVMVTDGNGCTKTEGLTVNLNDNAKVYKITAFSGSKTYDGDPIQAGKFYLKIDDGDSVPYLTGNSITLEGEDLLTATVEQGALTDAGEYSNSVTSYSVTRHGQDVTCLYKIEVGHGMVSIAKRPVTITSADSVAFMPITENCLTRHQVTVSGEGFIAADASRILYEFTGAVCDGAGIASNDFTVNWGSGNNAVNPDNYNVTYNYGTLTLIENGKLVVKALSEERTYDGTTTTYGQNAYSIAAYTVIENVGGVEGVNDTIFYNTPDNTTIEVNGRTYTVVVVLNGGSAVIMTDADTVDNVVTSVHVYEGTGTSHDITGSFDAVITENGVLQVNPIEITLTSYGDTWTYDARPHSRPGVSVEGAFLPVDISSAPSATRTETNAGKYPNTISYTTTSSFKAQNYNIHENVDTLVINKRPLYLIGVDKLVDYQNGVDQSTTMFTYGNLVSGHTATGISYLAHGESVGDHTGVFSGTLHVEDALHNDVTSNYEPIEMPGILGIQSPNALLKIKSVTQSHIYEGTPFTAQSYEVNYKGVRVNPLASDPHRFKLSSGDTLEVIPIGTGADGLTDVGSVKNSFRHQIHPLDHDTMYTNLEGDTGMVSVTKRPVILTSSAFTRTYDGTDITSEGITVSGNGFAGEEGASYTYENFATGSRTNVGTYANKFYYTLNTGTKAANYDIDTVYGKLIVTPAVLTVKAEDKTRPYGDANAFTYTISGYQHGEDESAISAGLNDVTYLCDGDQFANIGQYTITPVVDALVSQNYSFTTATGTLTVQKRQMKVTANSITVPYDGTAHNQTTNPPTIAEYTNIADGDEASATLNYQRTAGGEQAMTVSSVTITRNSGARDVTNNYTVTANENSKLIITIRELTLIVSDTTKVYDGLPLKASRYTVDPSTPLPANDAISNVQFTGQQIEPGENTNASIATGNIRITNSVTGQEVQGNSYHINVISGTLTVTDHDMTLTVPTVEQSTKTYDATALQPAATVSGQLAGTTPTIEYSTDGGSHWTTTVPSRTDVGSTPVKVRATAQYHETKTGEYTLTVNPASLTIAAKPQTYAYNGQAQGPAGTYTSGFDTYVTVTGLKGSDALTSITLSGSETNQGTYTGVIVPSAAEIGTKTGNYTISYTEANLAINKVTLTITAIDQSYIYNGVAQGENNATYTTAGDIAAKVTVEGLQNQDQLTSITLNGQETNKGVYELKIEPSAAAIGTATDNYTITYVKGKLTIDKAELTITAEDQTYTYNGSAQGEDNATYTDAAVIATKVSVEGLQGSDALASIKLNGNETNQGVYANEIVPSVAVVKNGSTDVTDNYTITYNNGKLTIERKAVTITANDASKT